ncbi:hypothetical protein [Corynebacterium glucuronolyticum]|uniref:hypothetical protein n=1 Tax=Corynebacterium glucuronolyticum TaxID=39791 RepID=UPI001F40C5B2|nr:hypothetical protein [Corynebacterium glucuronolyticum]
MFIATAVVACMHLIPVQSTGSDGEFSLGVLPQATAAEVADPDYQIKLRLDSSVVDSDGGVTESAREQLQAGTLQKVEAVAYVDTPDRALAAHGWTVRVKRSQEENSCELTFKKRFPLSASGEQALAKESVNQVLRLARERNFDSSDKNYDAQINTSFYTSTVDFSNKKETSCSLPFPTEKEALQKVNELLPGKLEKELGGEEAASHILRNLAMSNVVIQRTWPIEVAGYTSDLEVTEMNNSYFVELSEKDSSRKDAVEKREKIINRLQQLELLREQDAFKTSMVLDGKWD